MPTTTQAEAALAADCWLESESGTAALLTSGSQTYVPLERRRVAARLGFTAGYLEGFAAAAAECSVPRGTTPCDEHVTGELVRRAVGALIAEGFTAPQAAALVKLRWGVLP